jgi:hypothetical protein
MFLIVAFLLYFSLFLTPPPFASSQPYFNIHYRGEQQLFNVSLTPLIIVVADDDILCCLLSFFLFFFSLSHSHCKKNKNIERNKIYKVKWNKKNRDVGPLELIIFPSQKFYTQFHSDHDDILSLDS